MRIRVVLLILLALAITIAGVLSTASKNPQTARPSIPPQRDQLRWHAQQAKAKGQKQIILPAPTSDFSGSSESTTLDKALSFSSAVIAEPIDELVYASASNNEIGTWYKFKTIEILSEPVPPSCPECPFLDPPANWLPLGEGEFLISKYGGTLTIDGTKVSMSDGGWPPFRQGKKYLILLSVYPTGVAEVMSGPRGVFTLEDDGTLVPESNPSHPIRKGMDKKFGNSVLKLKEHLKFRKEP